MRWSWAFLIFFLPGVLALSACGSDGAGRAHGAADPSATAGLSTGPYLRLVNMSGNTLSVVDLTACEEVVVGDEPDGMAWAG